MPPAQVPPHGDPPPPPGDDPTAAAKTAVRDRILTTRRRRPLPERLRQARWMLEEYRISLWSQQLGTAHPVSDQRIRKVLG